MNGSDEMPMIPTVAGTIEAHRCPRYDGETETFIPVAHALRADGFDASEDGTGRGTPLVPVSFDSTWSSDFGVQEDVSVPLKDGHGTIPAVAYGLRSDAGRDGSAKTPSPDAEGRVRLRDPGFNVYEETAPTLEAAAPHAVAYQCQGSNVGEMGTLRAGNGQGGVPFLPIDLRQTSRGEKLTNNRATGSGGPPGHGVGDDGDPAFTVTERGQAVAGPMAVRRLTPIECERLMGLPDNYTLVPYRGKPAADGNRYKALGNSMAVPCMAWLGRRIQLVEEVAS